MTPALALFIFLAAPLGVLSQITLKESGPGMVKPEETLSLTCTVSGISLTRTGVGWVRQAPGEGLQWVGTIWDYGAINYNDALQSRLTITRDTASSQVHLRLTGLIPADTARYYCATYRAKDLDDWGQGTMVTVTSGDKAPDVFPMISSCKGSPTSTQVSVGCLVAGYFPEPVTMQWKKDSSTISTDVKNFPSALDLSKGLFTTSTQLTIPAASMSSHTYSCIVNHPKTKAHITKTIPGAGTAPTVRVLHSSCSVPSKDNNIELVCLISNFVPLPVAVDWLVDGTSGLVTFSTTTPRKNEDGKTYSTTSQANITQEEWLQGKTYTCKVTHSATATEKQDHARRCPVSTQAASDIQVYVVPPSPGDLYVKQSPELICMVINLPSKVAPKVTWTKDSPGALNAKPLQWVEQSNGTYTATRALPIFTPDWEKRQKFTCKVEHPELPSPLTKTISKKTGKQSAPDVYVFAPHHDDLNKKENPVSITCLVEGFYPEDISVQWMHNQTPVKDNAYATTAPMKETPGDSPYFLYSKLNINKSSWNNGDIFTCMVVHEALPMKFVQKSVQKQPGK